MTNHSPAGRNERRNRQSLSREADWDQQSECKLLAAANREIEHRTEAAVAIARSQLLAAGEWTPQQDKILSELAESIATALVVSRLESASHRQCHAASDEDECTRTFLECAAQLFAVPEE